MTKHRKLKVFLSYMVGMDINSLRAKTSIQLYMFRGMTRLPIENGSARKVESNIDYPPKPNGNKLHGVQMGKFIHGETNSVRKKQIQMKP